MSKLDDICAYKLVVDVSEDKSPDVAYREFKQQIKDLMLGLIKEEQESHAYTDWVEHTDYALDHLTEKVSEL